MALSRWQIAGEIVQIILSNLWLGPGALVGISVDRFVGGVGELIFVCIVFVFFGQRRSNCSCCIRLDVFEQ